ncbi:MAG TPA: lytic transglycosylase domain-containing protein [Blastocatellia bacterium]|nr:lytic transglycosylase domain-containing protein [Blastocatellia bacterium]
MFKLVSLFALVLIAMPLLARAQQKPLTAPERSPVPLTLKDQERARAEEQAKKQAARSEQPPQVKVPAALAGRHISSGNAAIDSLVYEAAAQHGLDPCLIFSVMRAESGFNRMAVSVKGASGLMQLMPATAARFGVRNIFDPRENIFGGTKYLRWLLDRFGGDVRLALAGYNAGEGAVEFYGHRIPPFLETQNYVRLIYSRYSGIHAGAAAEAVKAEAREATPSTGERYPTYNQIIRSTSTTGVRVQGAGVRAVEPVMH